MKFPKKVYVYIDKSDDDHHFIVAVHGVDQIPDDVDREMVATYKFKRKEQFIVRRILK